MKLVYKALSLSLIFCLSLVIAPFHIFADSVPDFDYTNYYQVEYLQSSGTEYIDLGNLCGLDFEIKMQLTEQPQSQRGYFGNHQVGAYFSMEYFSSNSRLYIANNQAKYSRASDLYEHTYKLNGLNFYDYINGVEASSITLSSYSLTNPNNFYMFRANGLNQGTKFKLFYAIIGDHNFIPCERKSDGKLGLYDTYTSTFYDNDSDTDGFISGDRINIPDDPVNPPTPTPTGTGTGNTYPSGSGTISGIGNASSGSVVTVTAVPNQGYKFVSWSDGSTDQTRQYTVGSGVYAIFEPESNNVSSNPLVGINANVTCIDTYGSSITLPRITYTQNNLQGTVNGYLVSTNNNNSVYDLSSSSSVSGGANGLTVTFNVGGYLSSNSNLQVNNLTKVLTEYEFILDNDYIGSVVINDGTNSITKYINGSSFTHSSMSSDITVESFTIESFNLRLNPNSSNLNTLVNGTESTNNSSSQLNDNKSDFDDSASDLISYEDGFNNNMNSALQNIDTNFNFNTVFGSKFLASASWVKTQFDRITGSSPFGSVLSFSLLLGLALLLVGKVFK